MANSTARLTVTLSYTGPGSETIDVPQIVRSCPYQAQTVGTVDVPTGTDADTELSVPFGAIDDSSTMLMVENKTGQEVSVAVNPAASATGVLSSGVVDIALDNEVGDFLSVVMTVSGGTPGVLSVKRKNATEVTVQSWLSGTGIQTADTSTVEAYNFKDGYSHNLPANSVFIPVVASAAPSDKPVTSLKVKLSSEQSAAGYVACRVFGDPT